ncbi:unnamed protein product [Ceutorhynchus assimilis]|uniref:Peptidase S1 domain-containing protein n=1 Tax=Ceutorhynchus assimilis TaxID=467358 RepID=A0A9N9MG75_9CUCU|nr:unnamed protein product [Ceutorhynchus assimilis]
MNFELVLVVCVVGLSHSQGQMPTFTCTIPSLCNGGGNIIDPRILSPSTSAAIGAGGFPSGNGGFPSGNGGSTGVVTPNVGIVSPTSCPSGYISCTSVICGTPSVLPGPNSGFATENAFPWQAFLRNNNNLGQKNGYAGGGVLLDQFHVLTAAHKISNLSSISVSMGIYNTGNTNNVQTSQVAQVWIHSNYNQTYLKNDVAILRLATPMYMNNRVMPICLPQSGRNYIGSSSASCVVSGWGQTNFNTDNAPTQTLKQARVPIVANNQCTNSYTNILGAANTAAYLDFPNEICAGGESQLDACTQDGGSPLVCTDSGTQYSLVGLVLWGKNCGQPGRYGVYLNVPAYIGWIQCTIQCLQGMQTCSSCPAQRYL